MVSVHVIRSSGYRPGKIVINRIKSISEENWNSFKQLLNEGSFWELPAEEPTVINPNGSITVYADGAQWVMEGVSDNQYHIVERRSPEGKYRDACLYLLELLDLG